MAWIISATNGKVAAKSQLRFLQAFLLIAHLTMLIALLRHHVPGSVRTSEPASGDFVAAQITNVNSPAAFALFTGLLLVLAFLGGNPHEPATNAAPTVPSALPTSPAPTLAACADPTACDAHDGLIARLHHELRTPLNAIMGFADLMHAETFGPLGNPRYRDYAAHMQSCGHDLLRATESALAMAALMTRPATNVREHIELVPLVDQAWTEASRSTTNSPIPLKVAIPAGLQARGDRAALHQSLVCLFEAALTRCLPASELTFSAHSAHGRIHAALDLAGARELPSLATTGCRPRTSALASIEELAIGVSRTLLGYQNATLTETRDSVGGWTITLSLEDAAQRDFFETHARPGPAIQQSTYSAGFFPALSLPGSRSA